MSAPATPTRDRNAQRRQAIARASAVRQHRALVKVDLKTRKVSLATVLRDDDPALQTMEVRDLLRAAPALGKAKVEYTLLMTGIGAACRLRDLSPQRREQLLHYLADRFPAVAASLGDQLEEVA